MTKCLLVGSGFMAREYLKVLDSLGTNATIVGRGTENVESLRIDFPKFKYFSGGVERFLEGNDVIFDCAINTCSINQLQATTLLLMNSNIRNILIEKPGALSISDLQNLNLCAIDKGVNAFIGYNRRFYSSLVELKNQLAKDGGIKSLHFEFTEWVHTINPDAYEKDVLNKWVLSNSSHVLDTVFHLIGLPERLDSYVIGKNIIPWHLSGSIFTGAGISIAGIPFTYHSNWQAPGRWSIEILTSARRFFLRPMEKLQVQMLGSIQVSDHLIDNSLDVAFKPGLFLQIESFFKTDKIGFVTLDHQIEAFKWYNRIAGYADQ
jgi:predicted dehydrogenase